MNAVARILIKSVVIPFYRSHAGLLLFVFLLMFGTVESNQLVNYHRSLIEGMFTSGAFLAFVCVVWTLYSIKIFLYVIALFRKPEYRFLTDAMLISGWSRFMNLSVSVVACFLPVLVYSVFIYAIGFREYVTISFGCLTLQLLLCSLSAYGLSAFLRTQHRFSWSIIQVRVPSIGGRVGIYLSHFLGEEKIALLISKGFSFGLLYIVREATERGDDFRILGLTWMFVLMSHAFLVQKVRLFEDRYLTWVKGLPIHLWRTCSAYLLFYVILLLPELAFSISMVNRFYEPFILALLSGGVLMFIHGYLLKPGRDPEKFSTFLFWLFILSFFAVLSKMILPLSVLLIVAACLRMRERYYRYEAISAP